MRVLTVFGVVFMLGAAAGCSKDKSEDPGSSVSEGAEDMGDSIEEGVEDTGDKIEEAAE